MYTPSQKKSHIREIQRYLHGISYYNDRIPRIIPDGYFGKETSTAVRAFQREYNLTETGTVTSETWHKIVEIYRDFISVLPIALDVFPSSKYIVHMGDSGLLIYIIQVLLNEIGVVYDEFPQIIITGVYDTPTSNAVKVFQDISNLNPTGNVNRQTWNHLVSTIHHHN